MRSKLFFLLALSFCTGVSGGMIAEGSSRSAPEITDDAFL
jgi:hypothetical protein